MLRMYSAATKERLLRPSRVGPLEEASHEGTSGLPGEGRFIRVWLRIEGGVVYQAAWASNGCTAMIAAASAIAELCEGRSASNLSGISVEDIIELIGTLPEGKEYAAYEAIEALREAMKGGL